jgi:hypothetical protein
MASGARRAARSARSCVVRGAASPELPSRLEAELLDGVPPAVAVDLQRVGLAPAAVQREHQLTP